MLYNGITNRCDKKWTASLTKDNDLWNGSSQTNQPQWKHKICCKKLMEYRREWKRSVSLFVYKCFPEPSELYYICPWFSAVINVCSLWGYCYVTLLGNSLKLEQLLIFLFQDKTLIYLVCEIENARRSDIKKNLSIL